MMQRNAGRTMLLILGTLALMSAALPAFATTTPPPSTCDQYAGLTARMAGCIRDSIDAAAVTFFAQIYPYLQGAIGAVMTLAVIFYGVALSFGAVEKIGRDTYIVMMKLACVVVFCNSSPWIVANVTRAMDGAASAVVKYTPASGTLDAAGTDAGQSQCIQALLRNTSSADAKVQQLSPWLGIDCLVDTVIGIHILPTTVPTHNGEWINKQLDTSKNEGMSRSLLYLFFSGMQTSVLGLLLAIIGFFFIYGILMLIVRCFFTYIAGYIGVTFLTIISPLIIPLVLFKETKQYFDKWAKMLVSFALQPVIMMVFLIFSLAAMDLCVYSGNYSIYYAIAGTPSQAANFDLNDYLTKNNIITQESKTALLVKADNPNAVPRDGRDTGGTLNQLLYSKCTPKDIAADPTLKAKCAFTYPVTLLRHTVKWDVMEKLHDPAIAVANNTSGKPVPGLAISHMVLSSLFFCLMTVFVLNGILQVVPMIVGDLLGDLNQSPLIGGLGVGSKAGGGGNSGSLSGLIKNPFKGMGAIGR